VAAGIASAALRVIYAAKLADAICLMYCFKKDKQAGYGNCQGTLLSPGKGACEMTGNSFANVWDAIEDTPAQAEIMKLRSVLMIALKDHIDRSGLSQSQAAKMLGVTQPRISDLVRGKIGLFSLDVLVSMAATAGLNIEMRVLDAP